MRTCPWCGRQFPARVVGAHSKKFCSSICKNRFHTALRRYGQQALAAGRLSVDDLKAAPASCTTPNDDEEGQDGGKAPTVSAATVSPSERDWNG